MKATLRQYFDYLWSRATLLNESREVNWDEVRHCGLKLGYTLSELNATINRIRNIFFSRRDLQVRELYTLSNISDE